jgi:hypothetical protein
LSRNLLHQQKKSEIVVVVGDHNQGLIGKKSGSESVHDHNQGLIGPQKSSEIFFRKGPPSIFLITVENT